jgi:hypothetical protein
MRIIWLIVLILCGILLTKVVSIPNYKRTHLRTKASDSCLFGASVVINDKYLAVGDPGANRVIIYQRNNRGKWRRTREILPPQDSTPFKIGNGFGCDLELDKNVLVISAATYQDTEDVTNPEYFQHRTNLISTFFGRYLTRIDREAEVRPIGLKIERSSGFVQFNLLSEGEIKSITLSDRGEKEFGFSVAIHKNLLLVGSPSERTGGGAWLFDLNTLENEPLKIVNSNFYTGLTVAVFERFAAVGDPGYWENWISVDYSKFSQWPPKTLIRSLENGLTSVIKSLGELSIDENILTIMFSPGDDREQPALLEIFSLDDNATPHLILKSEHFDNAWVQNGFLITVTNKENFIVPDVCIEPISVT